jgi:3-oxoacyl-[acyl-carrier protein] reductase
MVRVMSKDLARKSITVNAVAPGPTATELFLKEKSEEILKGIAAANPHNRIGTPEEVASAIVLLCTAAAQWICGQTILVNGGMA